MLSLVWIDSVVDDDTFTFFVIGRATVPTDTSKGVSLMSSKDYFKVA
jgi:hypothetical protein